MRSQAAFIDENAFQELELHPSPKQRGVSSGLRRRRIMTVLFAALGVSLLCAITFGSSIAWWATFVILPAALAYAAISVRIRRLEFEREMDEAFGNASQRYELGALSMSGAAYER